MIPDPGFETGASSSLWGASEVVSENAHTGSHAARLREGDAGSGSGCRRTITGLRPNTAYTFRAYVKTEGGIAHIGVKDYGSAEVTRSFNTASYQAVEVRFATGDANTSATCYIYNGPGDASVVYVDDLSLDSTEPDWPQLPTATGEYQLIFSDEFNSEGGIDLTKWNPEIGFKRNNEAQYYRAENLSQSGGNLVITAKREQVLNANYDPNASDWRRSRQYAYWTSGSIKSENSFNFLYGKIECRAKVTNLPGTWPAIWTVGGGEWPATGEIDIMENFDGRILANFATADSGRYTPYWDSVQVNVSSLPMIDQSPWVDHFHIWELVWEPDVAAIYMDGVLLNTFNPQHSMRPIRMPIRELRLFVPSASCYGSIWQSAATAAAIIPAYPRKRYTWSITSAFIKKSTPAIKRLLIDSMRMTCGWIFNPSKVAAIRSWRAAISRIGPSQSTCVAPAGS